MKVGTCAVESSDGFSSCGRARGVLWDETERDDRSKSSCLWGVPWRSDDGVSYDAVVSVSLLWVTLVVESSSVAVCSCVVSPWGCSSYPDRETLALASKNCFQNCRSLERV